MNYLRDTRFAIAMTLALGAWGCSSSESSSGTDGAPRLDAAQDGGGGGGGDGAVDTAQGDAAPGTAVPFIILHTNDLHSHLMGFGPESEYTPATTGDDVTVGGLARLASRIAADRAAAGTTPVLLLDSGDFMMGTLFHILGTGAAAELVEMNKLKYDAITIGNHELDFGPAALAKILSTAAMKGVTIPTLATNMTFSATDPGDDALAAVMAAGGLRRKLIKEVGGIKFGFFGLMGKDASDVSALKKPLTFEDIAVSARAAVTELRQMDKVDVVIALSHSGIDPMGMGEDRKLAEDAMVKAAGGIDVIISGHTHDKLDMPTRTGNTWIVQTGAYGRFLGKLQMTVTRSASGPATLALTKYELEPIDDMVAGDAPTQAAVDAYVAAIDGLLGPAGFTYKKLIAQTTVDVTGTAFAESGIGNLVTDAYLNVTKALQPTAPPVLAIDATGDLRADLRKGKMGRLWLADLFQVQPLGVGPDMNPGFPLVTFYINGKDIKAGFEFSAAAKPLNKTDYFLHVSGATVNIKTGALFQQVTSVKIGADMVDFADTTRCYKVVTNIYVASLLGLIETVSGGVLSVKPKAADCMTLVDPGTQIVDRNPATPELEELKNWQALTTFVGSQPDATGDGIPDVPSWYGGPQEPPRIVITP
jgi:5'-nucleotidase/UDP-sugar diphosphatase